MSRRDLGRIESLSVIFDLQDQPTILFCLQTNDRVGRLGMLDHVMQRFLREHSTSGLPANVAASLAEWGRKREALT